MVRSAVLFIFFVFALCFNDFIFAEETWMLVSGIKESDMQEVAVDADNKGVVYAASSRTLYRSGDDGNTWKAVFSAKGDADSINFISASLHGVFVCTEKGVFKSRDGKSEGCV